MQTAKLDNSEKTPRVLLVDDEKYMRDMIKLILNELKYEVVAEAENGLQALDFCSSERPDMVFLDINMPGETGDSIITQILDINYKTIIIMLTSVNDKTVIMKCIQRGAKNYILKGNGVDKIQETIKETWQKFKPKKKSTQ